MSLAANTTAASPIRAVESCVAGKIHSAPARTNFIWKFRCSLPALFALGLFLLGLLIYSPILPGGFIMDDLKLVQWDNPIVNGTAGPQAIWFRADFPLSTLVFWLEWKAWGTDPLGYHLMNVTLHALASFLLWLVLIRLRVRGAGLAALLYMVHPVCVGTVARIAELKNTLSMPLFLLSAWAYLGYERSLFPADQEKCRDTAQSKRFATLARPDWRATCFYSLSVAAFVLALLAKTSVIMLPVVLLGCAVWQRNRICRKDILHLAPYFALSLGFGLMSAWFQKCQALGGESLASQSILFKVGSAARICCFYLWKAICPANLNIIYPRWDSAANAQWGTAACVFVLCAVSIAAWIWRQRGGRHVLFGLFCFAAILFPAMGFFEAQFLRNWQVSDHLQYAALAASMAMVAAFVSGVKWLPLRRLAPLALPALLMVLSHDRAKLFQTEEVLLRDAVGKNPAAWAAHNDLGCLVAQQNNIPEALAHFERSLRHNPDFPDAHLNMAQALLCLQRPTEAAPHFAAVLHHNPAHAEAHRGTARVLIAQNRQREALLHFRAALRTKPDAQTHVDLSAILYQTGQRAAAASELRAALKLNPDHVDALNNLAWLIATDPDPLGRNGLEAVRCARRACMLTEMKQAHSLGTLAAAYAEAGRFEPAIRIARKAVHLANASREYQFAANVQQLLELYKRGLPYHEPARESNAPARGVNEGSADFPKGQ